MLSERRFNNEILLIDGEMKPIGVLKGHCKGGVPSIKWSNEDEHKLLSTGFDGTVRIWNTKTLECTTIYQSRGPTFCATFWPKDENFVICSGFNESLYMFDTRNRMDEWICKYETCRCAFFVSHNLYFYTAKPLKEKPDDLKWAVAELTDAQQLISLERKVNRKTARQIRRSGMSKASDCLKDVELDEKTNDITKHEPIVNMELNHTTVLYLSHKEFNKKGIEILKDMIFEEDDQPNHSLHRLLFSGKDETKQLLDIECKCFEFRVFLVAFKDYCILQSGLFFLYSAKSQRFHNRFNWSRVYTTVKLQPGNRN